MKRLKYILQFLAVISLLGTVSVWPGYAQEGGKSDLEPFPKVTPQPATNPITTTHAITTTLTPDQLTFERLGFDEKILYGPFDSLGGNLYLPADWKLTGGTIELDLTAFFGGIGLKSSEDTDQLLGGALEVTFNGKALDTVSLDHKGDYHVTIPLTEEVLLSAKKDGHHEFRLSLDSALSCRFDTQTNITVHGTSSFNLLHEVVPLPIDLRLFPYPLFQQSIVPDVATVVVPDKPAAEELQAALAVMAGLGRLTSGKIEATLIPIGQLTDEIRNTTHLILVGKPDHLPILPAITLPASPGKAGFELKEAKPNDGLIQIALSPWNPSRVVLVVTGNSDRGVAKAGQAVSSGVIRVGERPDLAIVADVQPVVEEVIPVSQDQTFADLGYSDNELAQRGTNWAEYVFYVPADKTTTPEAYLDIIFNHSSLLDYSQSGMAISLNGESIGSLQFSEESTKQKSEKFTIPRHILRSGPNTLLVRVELIPNLNCTNPNMETLWLKFWPESSLHLPLIDNPIEIGNAFDLDNYPEPFVFNPTLGDIAIVLPSADPASWQVAARLAFDLGRRTPGSLRELAVVFGNEIPQEIRQERHLLIIGKASQLPIIAELNELLPAPFEPNNDLAIEENVNVIYRFPQGTDMGYLELIPSPWNETHLVMAVLGSTPTGLGWAAQALMEQELQNQLSGNFAVVNDQQIVVGNVRSKPDTLEVAVTTPAAETAPTPTPSGDDTLLASIDLPTDDAEIQPETSPQGGPPNWLLPVLATSTGLMIAVIIFTFIASRRK
jgi:cellulose synthase operon protein B